MRPVHFLSDGFMLTRIFSPFGTAYPQRFCPHCSMRTIPPFFSVFHTPSGVVAGSTGAVRVASDVMLSLALGAADVAITSVEADGALLAAPTGGWGTAACSTG